MTDLFDRMFPAGGDDNIAIHPFTAAMIDYMAGETTRNQMVAAWTLDSEAQTDLDVLLAAMDALTTVQEKLRFIAELDATCILAEQGLKYTTKAAFKTRLGL